MVRFMKLLVLSPVALTVYGQAASRAAAVVETSPALSSIGPLTFAPNGTLYAADTQAATIFALDLGMQANGGAPGTASVAGIDQKIAAMLGYWPPSVGDHKFSVRDLLCGGVVYDTDHAVGDCELLRRRRVTRYATETNSACESRRHRFQS